MKKIGCLMLVVVIGLILIACKKKEDDFDEGRLYSIDEAYANEFISKEDLIEIAYYYNSHLSVNEFPTTLENSHLSDRKIKGIKIAWRDDVLKMSDASLDKINISSYYGTYRSCSIVFMSDTYLLVDPYVEVKHLVDGVLFQNYIGYFFRCFQPYLYL
jgi:hypothetical protein